MYRTSSKSPERERERDGEGGMSHGGGGGGEESSETNMAAWLVGLNTLKIQPFKLPPLGPHDVRVRMKAVGICGSDVHYLKTLKCAHFVVEEPMVIGHECAGVIEEVGSDVKYLVVGDRVALEPGISCWRCDLCKTGSYNLCPEMKFFATPPVHGSLANQRKGQCVSLLVLASMLADVRDIGPETNVLIMGAGPIGLVTMLSTRAFGAPRVIIVDVDDNRLAIAKNLGADDVVKVSIDIKVRMLFLYLFSMTIKDCFDQNETYVPLVWSCKPSRRHHLFIFLEHAN
ncbi:hypothetical protein Scep_026182 [Stephania cephalantha]|uniref:Sorbitol dehydrogenase n=1 Tax=Stephania cephalantha TaxID=152367 RepID=A0AAP0EQ88_9MAGN